LLSTLGPFAVSNEINRFAVAVQAL
jgi:hypothetical protein